MSTDLTAMLWQYKKHNNTNTDKPYSTTQVWLCVCVCVHVGWWSIVDYNWSHDCRPIRRSTYLVILCNIMKYYAIHTQIYMLLSILKAKKHIPTEAWGIQLCTADSMV